MHRTAFALLLAVSTAAGSTAAEADKTAPAPEDRFLWLEDVTGEKSLDWARARNAESAKVLVTPEEAALENTRFWSPLSLSKEQKHDITDPVEMERAADALPIEQIAKRWIVGTDPDAVVAEVKQYVDWGMNHLVFHAPGHDQRRFLQLFERDLAPRLRALA